jgi:hypothetical protein
MIGWQRVFRHALVVSALGRARILRDGFILSALGHAAFLASPLLLLHTSSVPPILPDAMPVEIVEIKEPPRYSGTPSPLRQSGTETDAKAVTPDKVTQRPQPQPAQRQKPQKERRAAKQNEQQKPTETKAAEEQPQIAPSETGKIAMAQPDPPAPAAEETPDEPDTVAKMAQLAMMGGRLGGGIAAPPIGSPLVGYDFTLFFRERVSSCTARPPEIAPSERISITTRVFLNRDGTLAEAPQLTEPHPTAKQQALMRSFVSGLQQCQPYTMLPPDRYTEWKRLDLMVYPTNVSSE